MDTSGFDAVAIELVRILELGDLETANVVLDGLEECADLLGWFYGSQARIQGTIKWVQINTFKVACGITWSAQRSLTFLKFAGRCGNLSGLDTDITALATGVQYHNEAVFRHCLQYTDTLDQRLVTQGGFWLYQMIACGFSALVHIGSLLSRGVDANWSDTFGRTALHLAAQAGLEAEVDERLVHGALIVADQHGHSPLHKAVKSGRLQVLRSVMDHTPGKADHICAVSQAVIQDAPEMFHFLLQ